MVEKFWRAYDPLFLGRSSDEAKLRLLGYLRSPEGFRFKYSQNISVKVVRDNVHLHIFKSDHSILSLTFPQKQCHFFKYICMYVTGRDPFVKQSRKI